MQRHRCRRDQYVINEASRAVSSQQLNTYISPSHFSLLLHLDISIFDTTTIIFNTLAEGLLHRRCQLVHPIHQAIHYLNKCIGGDTKAAARQSLNCIKNKKIRRKTIFNMADWILTLCNVARSWHWYRQVTALCNVACGSGIVTENSPSGSTL